MVTFRLFILGLLISFVDCGRPEPVSSFVNNCISVIDEEAIKGKEALLLTRFKSLKDLESVVKFTYVKPVALSAGTLPEKSRVDLSFQNNPKEVISTLKSGVNESDFIRARKGNLWNRAWLGLHSPYAVLKRKDLMRIDNLARKRPPFFGKGDVAFYDLAETMVHHISEEDVMKMSSEDLSEKGYLNTFNHITAQAFMTTLFSETLADFVADVHERQRMPELITGIFTADQLADLENGPVDNYIDMINNEWGQDIGKLLRRKYGIRKNTVWTPALLANFMNDIQSYQSWAFQIGFEPFRPSDEIIIRFSSKINNLMEGVPKLSSYL